MVARQSGMAYFPFDLFTFLDSRPPCLRKTALAEHRRSTSKSRNRPGALGCPRRRRCLAGGRRTPSADDLRLKPAMRMLSWRLLTDFQLWMDTGRDAVFWGRGVGMWRGMYPGELSPAGAGLG